jgi:hypothetical protein
MRGVRALKGVRLEMFAKSCWVWICTTVSSDFYELFSSELSRFFGWRAGGCIAAHALRIITGVAINVYHRISAQQRVVHWFVGVFRNNERTEA